MAWGDDPVYDEKIGQYLVESDKPTSQPNPSASSSVLTQSSGVNLFVRGRLPTKDAEPSQGETSQRPPITMIGIAKRPANEPGKQKPTQDGTAAANISRPPTPIATQPAQRSSGSSIGITRSRSTEPSRDRSTKESSSVPMFKPPGSGDTNPPQGQSSVRQHVNSNGYGRSRSSEAEHRNRNGPSSTLHVSNLPLSATEDGLKLMFGKVGNVVGCRVIKDQDGGCRGTAFVEYSSIRSAQAAIAALGGQILDRQTVKIEFAVDISSRKSEKQADAKDSTTTVPSGDCAQGKEVRPQDGKQAGVQHNKVGVDDKNDSEPVQQAPANGNDSNSNDVVQTSRQVAHPTLQAGLGISFQPTPALASESNTNEPLDRWTELKNRKRKDKVDHIYRPKGKLARRIRDYEQNPPLYLSPEQSNHEQPDLIINTLGDRQQGWGGQADLNPVRGYYDVPDHLKDMVRSPPKSSVFHFIPHSEPPAAPAFHFTPHSEPFAAPETSMQRVLLWNGTKKSFRVPREEEMEEGQLSEVKLPRVKETASRGELRWTFPVWCGKLVVGRDGKDEELGTTTFVARDDSEGLDLSDRICVTSDDSYIVKVQQEMLADPRARFFLVQSDDGMNLSGEFVNEDGMLKVGRASSGTTRLCLIPMLAFERCPPSVSWKQANDSSFYENLLAVFLDTTSSPSMRSEQWKLGTVIVSNDWAKKYAEAAEIAAKKRKALEHARQKATAERNVEIRNSALNRAGQKAGEQKASAVRFSHGWLPSTSTLLLLGSANLPPISNIFYRDESVTGGNIVKFVPVEGHVTTYSELAALDRKLYVKEEDDGDVFYVPFRKWVEEHTSTRDRAKVLPSLDGVEQVHQNPTGQLVQNPFIPSGIPLPPTGIPMFSHGHQFVPQQYPNQQPPYYMMQPNLQMMPGIFTGRICPRAFWTCVVLGILILPLLVLLVVHFVNLMLISTSVLVGTYPPQAYAPPPQFFAHHPWAPPSQMGEGPPQQYPPPAEPAEPEQTPAVNIQEQLALLNDELNRMRQKLDEKSKGHKG
ncbi:uncharacterized protein SPPG_02185 [Spizellomyces punctatus DAOM BR117]|uniref:RRM domain-containing protein n=1 Tax=Spizellomyces punctatus (strain DAOM BR117) TaxID=645134 RepID=A0A0L0HQP3_SPIPD|nr:uncharacterized protein SPPG_02185 [Spizellomyces punctatus DAOM BR117]KND03124.1 hypothetical protein SPPG_02185 [Spizellomyces punctatus DAOM BR117]|eukprot:XP_016611163.1 hypothetical protein SPPG_02185 [Spizellomyces punctatus DAOM BR117]